MSSQPFSNIQTAKSTTTQLWELYKDVENWKNWDTEIEWSKLDGDFQEGSIGQLKAKGSPVLKFEITKIVQNKRFEYQTNVPFGKLVVDHTFEQKDNLVEFKHTVYFTGPLNGIFDFILGRGFRKVLPDVLNNIKNILETTK